MARIGRPQHKTAPLPKARSGYTGFSGKRALRDLLQTVVEVRKNGELSNMSKDEILANLWLDYVNRNKNDWKAIRELLHFADEGADEEQIREDERERIFEVLLPLCMEYIPEDLWGEFAMELRRLDDPTAPPPVPEQDVPL